MEVGFFEHSTYVFEVFWLLMKGEPRIYVGKFRTDIQNLKKGSASAESLKSLIFWYLIPCSILSKLNQVVVLILSLEHNRFQLNCWINRIHDDLEKSFIRERRFKSQPEKVWVISQLNRRIKGRTLPLLTNYIFLCIWSSKCFYVRVEIEISYPWNI